MPGVPGVHASSPAPQPTFLLSSSVCTLNTSLTMPLWLEMSADSTLNPAVVSAPAQGRGGVARSGRLQLPTLRLGCMLLCSVWGQDQEPRSARHDMCSVI